MGNDVPYEIATADGPLIEVPVQWIMDDAPLFRHVYGSTNAIADPARVFNLWSTEFAAMHKENACFVLTCHPFISGRASRVQLIEDLECVLECEEHHRARAGRRPPLERIEAASRLFVVRVATDPVHGVGGKDRHAA